MKDKIGIRPHRFVLNMGKAVHIGAQGTKVKRAELIINDEVVSVITPKYEAGFNIEHNIYLLSFFGDGVPFRGNLTTVHPSITLYVKTERPPTIAFGLIDDAKVEDYGLGEDKFEEKIKLQQEDGEVETHIRYERDSIKIIS